MDDQALIDRALKAYFREGERAGGPAPPSGAGPRPR